MKTIRVEETDEFLRFEVQSASERKAPHGVDLLALDGNGECSCKDFKIKCRNNIKDYVMKHGLLIPQPYLVRGRKTPNPDRTVCKHIHVSNQKAFSLIKLRYAHAHGLNSKWVEALKQRHEYEKEIQRRRV